ncbi:hypothetical protein JKP88DRAFT_289207 [Tribonema minus]|uniref:RGS domain-containing protein n=1 Tax=Tribonema minus TaxID=303371 RepID=A0A835Z3G7_9STRA|nr:hypothetical protein JKP88DRAFT_289207 [Tribonema minus]
MVLVTLTGIQECFRLSGGHLPCGVVLWISSIAPGILMTSVLLRGARVIIITSKAYRARFMFLLDTKTQGAAIVAAALGMAAFPAIVQPTRAALHTDFYCMFWVPWWFWLGYLSCGSSAVFAQAWMMHRIDDRIGLGVELMRTYTALYMMMHRIDDRIGLGVELTRTYTALYICFIPYWIILALMDHGIMSSNAWPTVLITTACLYQWAEIFVFSRRFWANGALNSRGFWGSLLGCACFGSRRYAVLPCGGGTTDGQGRELSKWAQARQKYATTLQLLNSPTLTEAYGRYVQQALCFESFAFLAAVVQYASDAYADMAKQALCASDAYVDMGKQFDVFDAIVTDFILPGGRFEVLKKHERMLFYGLNDDERRGVFKTQAAEVGRMLDQNLMLSFHNTDSFRKAFEEQRQIDEEATLSGAEDGTHTPLPAVWSPASTPKDRALLKKEVRDGGEGAVTHQ